jgi:hypothetical protein
MGLDSVGLVSTDVNGKVPRKARRLWTSRVAISVSEIHLTGIDVVGNETPRLMSHTLFTFHQ